MRSIIRKRFLARLSVLVIALFIAPSLSYQVKADEVSPEYLVKAGFLFNFAKFVSWPEEDFLGNDAQFNYCVLGDNPFGDALDTVEAESIKGHPVRVRILSSPDNIHDCHLLFVVGNIDVELEIIASTAKEQGILTVGESDDFIYRGGIIQFVPQGNKIGFEVNAGNAGVSNISISSKLLSLAHKVTYEVSP